jgi:GNAT superfamily N-acetyltransferase
MRSDLLARLATPGERHELEALQRRASLANQGDRASLLAHPDAIDLPLEQIESGRVIVAEVGGTVMGFAAIIVREDGDGELDALFVDPTSWRQGIGRGLVEESAELAGSLGATSLHVVGNPHAEGFYAACGFVMLGTTETRFGRGLLMRLTLT